MRKLIGALLVAGCVASSVGQAASVMDTYVNTIPTTFFQRGDEGWYWYHDPIPAEEEEKIKENLPSFPPLKIEPPKPTENKPAPPAPFSLAWVKAMLPKYMETAWNNPTKENVEAYFLVQRFALDRANSFADMAQKVVVGNMALDETIRRPVASPGSVAANVAYAENTAKLVKQIGEHAGLWFFFKSSCRYCEAQAPILKWLEAEGINVLAVSLDGGELQNGKFDHTYTDSGQAAKLGVTATPAMYLVSEDGKFDALGMSVLSLGELRQRIILVGARNGWISENELKEASPLINQDKQIDLGKQLPMLLKASADPTALFSNDASAQKLVALANTDTEKLNGLLQADNFIDPKKLVELVGGHRSGTLIEEEE